MVNSTHPLLCFPWMCSAESRETFVLLTYLLRFGYDRRALVKLRGVIIGNISAVIFTALPEWGHLETAHLRPFVLFFPLVYADLWSPRTNNPCQNVYYCFKYYCYYIPNSLAVLQSLYSTCFSSFPISEHLNQVMVDQKASLKCYGEDIVGPFESVVSEQMKPI